MKMTGDYDAQLATFMALAPSSVRQQMMGRNVLRVLGGQSPRAVDAAVASHLASARQRTLLYPGPADDVAPIPPLLSRYNHFVYVDMAPTRDVYFLDTMALLESTLSAHFRAMRVSVARVMHDPISSRLVWLLTRGNKRGVLEYFYDTPFDLLKSKMGMKRRGLLLREMTRVEGLYVSPSGPGPRWWFARNLLPSLTEIVDMSSPGFVATYGPHALPKSMRHVVILRPPLVTRAKIALQQRTRRRVRDRLWVQNPTFSGNMFGNRPAMNELADVIASGRPIFVRRGDGRAMDIARSRHQLGTPVKGGLIPLGFG